LKLFSIHYADDLKLVEKNHKKFCANNGIEYNKFRASPSAALKYSFILQELQRNFGETLIFIDSSCYFNKFKTKFDFNKSKIWFQKEKNYSFDNFIVIKSDEETIKLFSKISFDIDKTTFGKFYTEPIHIDIPEKYIIPHSYRENDQYFCLRIGMCNDYSQIEESLVLSTDSVLTEEKGLFFAEACCAAKEIKQENLDSKLDFEIINPNKTKALVMLYTDEIKEYGATSEESIKSFCQKNDHTLYVYRKVPELLKRMSGSWTKPFVLLKHMKDHEFIGWIDGDILIGEDFKNIFEDDVAIFRDPSGWLFNSGFMMFKNTQKNYDLLMKIVHEIGKLENLNGVYNYGGDQKLFIEFLKKDYPYMLPLSSRFANTHPVSPEQINPRASKDKMIHFMGFKKILRSELIKGYNALMRKQK
jgi:hypothetical protein